jgi:hypothetical protein
MTSIPSRARLLSALVNPDPNNPIAGSIVAACDNYTRSLEQQMMRAGGMPESIVLPTPVTEIEAFALELFIRQLGGSGIRVMLTDTSKHCGRIVRA